MALWNPQAKIGSASSIEYLGGRTDQGTLPHANHMGHVVYVVSYSLRPRSLHCG
jgi:hypothetical protein